MGETGCGKTRLVKFMCELQSPPGVKATNMVLLKVHGGTTNKDIIKTVKKAEEIARKNRQDYGENVYTVLFFDEANTTESIGLIKEIMCDKTLDGKKLTLCENLKMVAACNPYRKHSEELIRRLEQAGLGYHVDADETTDRLGRVPMRRLVYRVQPLPQSLLPLVWDFGQLSIHVEELYIRQMVRRYIREKKLPTDIPKLLETISVILTASQAYMREQKDECSFVSLRDVDRVLEVMSWFYSNSRRSRTLFDLMDTKLYEDHDNVSSDDEEDEDEEEEEMRVPSEENTIDDVTRSLILALGVCYHACLKARDMYRSYIAQFFNKPCYLPGGAEQIRKEIECCQDVFLDNISLGKNIARNLALKENIFLTVVCIELRIPLFLVGKPGSSKSLAKTIVSDAMQGRTAKNELFGELKQVHMISYQCSPLSTPDGIVGTFEQCARFQKKKDLQTFVSVVVLDEVGLAEDSPRMPLKALHPLLEDGCQGDEEPKPHKKVAFVGLSNWSLDPAKMNRGIMVHREVPELEELENSASGICQVHEDIGKIMIPCILPMAKSYLEVFKKASECMREFYGLRDFYSLVKMVYNFVEKSKQPPTWHEMVHAIKRNFGGLDEVDPVKCFKNNMATIFHFNTQKKLTDPESSTYGLIQACLFDTKIESRYLLLLTENYGALSVIQQILSRGNDIRPITIFGSSFRSDQEYTQVCRNINKIKVCMETGNTVVLLNLENLYESLYDALNQYYVTCCGERYVDLGLGTHRVKCPVHKNFRLIVVAEKQTVYKQFPIPLINRLEKHFLSISTLLTEEQQRVVERLHKWTKEFAARKQNALQFTRKNSTSSILGDVFIGYHEDACAAAVLHAWNKSDVNEATEDQVEQVFLTAKYLLLWCAAPEALETLEYSHFPPQETKMLNIWYNETQSHENIFQYLNDRIMKRRPKQLFAQVTTRSKLLAGVHKEEISRATGLPVENILLLESLSSFDTEQQFTNRIQRHMQIASRTPCLIVVQCDSGDANANLIACARYCVMDEFEKKKDEIHASVYAVFIIQLSRTAEFTGFQCGLWHSVHIDDLYVEEKNMPTIQYMRERSVASIFADAIVESDNTKANSSVATTKVNGSKGDEGKIQANREHDRDVIEPEEADSATRPMQMAEVFMEQRSILNNEGNPKTVPLKQDGINIGGLILKFMHSAMSLVKDTGDNSRRETERLLLVLKLLDRNDKGQRSFLRGVCCLLAKILQQREAQTNNQSMAQQWLINEAAAKDNIKKAGTFRRSCLQTLQAKVSPILAGVIAYLDTNGNLSILEESTTLWKEKLWLAFLNDSETLDLQFSDFQSPTRHTELTEVIVPSTGCESHTFRARMPFSWLIIKKISEFLKLPYPYQDRHEYEEVQQEGERCVEATVNVLSEHPVGRILSWMSEDPVFSEAVKEYTHDFVHTMYNATSDQELQIILEIVLLRSRRGRQRDILHRLVQIHSTFESLAADLTYFREMNSVWPECSEVALEQKKTIEDQSMLDFTSSVVHLMIRELSPVDSELDNPKGQLKWLGKFHRYRPVVENIINYLAREPEIMNKTRGLWNRVMVVRLFLEHVCADRGENLTTVARCMPLWGILADNTDLKDIKSFEKVELFLKTCNKQAIKDCFGAEQTCSQCEVALEGPPVMLPCKDVVCDQCFDGLKAIGGKKCVKCNAKFPSNWEPVRQKTKQLAIDKLKDYQTRCNSFVMDVVSQLCFAGNTAPSPEVIGRLMGYMIFTTRARRQRTRDLTIFDTGIDPNPVFRSFLLQLLMRTSETDVMRNLESYLERANEYLQQGEGNQAKEVVDLSLLVIHCLEDRLAQEAGSVAADEVKLATKALNRSTQGIESDTTKVEKLYCLASARMGLSVVAKYVAEIITKQVEPRQVALSVRKMIETAQILCDDTEVKWTKIYLVKLICRRYGIDVYRSICPKTWPFLRWIHIKDLDQEEVVEMPDRYTVCGGNYISLREAVVQVILGEDLTHLAKTVQEMQNAHVKVEPLLQLAIHREISNSHLYRQPKKRLSQEVLNNLSTFIMTSDALQNKHLTNALIQNELGPEHLVVREGTSLRQQGIQCLIVHFKCNMSSLEVDKTLLQPMLSLMIDPENCADMFLPSMPQDDVIEAREALLATRRRGGDENPVFYRCPNGHPYVIGNCGRPNTVDTCRDCGAAIGGHGHQIRPGNVLDHGKDTTVKGHILGRADTRSQGPKPERTLSPVFCSIVRLFLHVSMYIGSGNNPLGVCQLIKPEINVDEVEDFLWTHIEKDVDDLHRITGRSIDDVLTLLHILVENLMKIHNTVDIVQAEVCRLSSKRGRQQWEENFSAKFLQPVLQNMDKFLKEANRQIAEDRRLGADPLLCLLYETDSAVDKEGIYELQDNPQIWRYRIPVSLAHLRQETMSKMPANQHRVLQYFLNEEHHLRALRYIPSILQLHRALFQKYQRKLDKAEASLITIGHLKKEAFAGDKTTELLTDFADAWDFVRDSLEVCKTEGGASEYCNKPVTDKTPVSFLLPSIQGAGLCSYALLDFLIRKQNSFLDTYLRESKRCHTCKILTPVL